MKAKSPPAQRPRLVRGYRVVALCNHEPRGTCGSHIKKGTLGRITRVDDADSVWLCAVVWDSEHGTGRLYPLRDWGHDLDRYTGNATSAVEKHVFLERLERIWVAHPECTFQELLDMYGPGVQLFSTSNDETFMDEMQENSDDEPVP